MLGTDVDMTVHDAVDGLNLPQTQADAIPLTQPSTPASAPPSSPPDPPRPAKRRHPARSLRYVDDEAGVSGDDTGDESASDGDAASLADFIVPDHEQLDRYGLVHDGDAFPEDDALDYAAIVRERRPFAAFRRAGAAGGSSAADADAPPPSPPVVEGASREFIVRVSKATEWLTSPDHLFDAECSAKLVAQIREGYVYDKEARRQAKETAGQHAGKMELTACVDYCTHILVNKLGLTWAGTTGGGALMVHDRVQQVVCLPLRLDDVFLTVQQVLQLFILEHPSNHYWKDLILGRAKYAHVQDLCQLRLPQYTCRWNFVAYTDVVFDVATGEQTPRDSFKPEVSGYCSKVFGVPFPTRFDLPGTTAILADQGYGIYAVMFLFAIMGRLLFPLGDRDNWIQLLYFLGKTQTGKTTLFRMMTEGCLEERAVRNIPSDPSYPLQSLFVPTPGRIWSNGDMLIQNLLKSVQEDQLLKLIDGSEQAYAQKYARAVERRNPMQGFVLSNKPATAAGDAGGALSSRLLYFPFFRPVDERRKNTVLGARMMQTEAPVFLVVCSVFYRALVLAVGADPIQSWYPTLCQRLKAEIAEDLHGFIRVLNASTTKVPEGGDAQHIELSVAVQFYNDYLKRSPNQEESRAWQKIKGTKALIDRLQEAGYTVQNVGGAGVGDDGKSTSRAIILRRRWLTAEERHVSASMRQNNIMDGGLPPTHSPTLASQIHSIMRSLNGRYTESDAAAPAYKGGALVNLLWFFKNEYRRDRAPVSVADDDSAPDGVAPLRPQPYLIRIDKEKRTRAKRSKKQQAEAALERALLESRDGADATDAAPAASIAQPSSSSSADAPTALASAAPPHPWSRQTAAGYRQHNGVVTAIVGGSAAATAAVAVSPTGAYRSRNGVITPMVGGSAAESDGRALPVSSTGSYVRRNGVLVPTVGGSASASASSPMSVSSGASAPSSGSGSAPMSQGSDAYAASPPATPARREGCPPTAPPSAVLVYDGFAHLQQQQQQQQSVVYGHSSMPPPFASSQSSAGPSEESPYGLCSVCRTPRIAKQTGQSTGFNAGRWFVNCPRATIRAPPGQPGHDCNKRSFKWRDQYLTGPRAMPEDLAWMAQRAAAAAHTQTARQQ